jgi:IMP dehydrogenase
MRVHKAYSFDDVMLVPSYSEMNSRADVDLSTSVAGVTLRIPIIAANMSSVCEDTMAIALGKMGGLGIIHRMCSIEREAMLVKTVHDTGQQVDMVAGDQLLDGRRTGLARSHGGLPEIRFHRLSRRRPRPSSPGF